MTAATITTKVTQLLAEDNVVLTASDGETYVTRLSSVVGAHVSVNEDVNGLATATMIRPSVAISGRTITIHADGLTDKKVFLTVRGYL